MESILFSHLIITSILILNIIIPLLNSLNIKDNSLDLFNSFYKTIIVSFFINFVYLKLSDIIPGKINKNYKRIVVILIGSVLLNYYISNTPYEIGTIKFMKEWIKNIGWFGIIWDLINVMSVAKLADKINTFNMRIMIYKVRYMFNNISWFNGSVSSLVKYQVITKVT